MYWIFISWVSVSYVEIFNDSGCIRTVLSDCVLDDEKLSPCINNLVEISIASSHFLLKLAIPQKIILLRIINVSKLFNKHVLNSYLNYTVWIKTTE